MDRPNRIAPRVTGVRCRSHRMAIGLRLLVLALLALAWPRAATAEEAAAPAAMKLVYVELGDFTVNLPQDERRYQYVLLSVPVETQQDTAAAIKSIMPRIKEAVVRQLITMSDHHQLEPDQTDPLVFKDALTETIGKVQDGVHDVLILRMLFS